MQVKIITCYTALGFHDLEMKVNTKRYEHFAHELIAAENHISHLDGVFGANRGNSCF